MIEKDTHLSSILCVSGSLSKMATSPEDEHPMKAFGQLETTLGTSLPSTSPEGEEDVRFKVLYSGLCHSDLHHLPSCARIRYMLTNFNGHLEWHEIVGVVTEVGSKVNNFKVGDKVGVGHTCSQYHDGTICYGGYSDTMVANEHYVLHIPDNMPLDVGAPLLCAGITVYSSLRYFGLSEPGMHVIVGLGGLGHLAVKFAKAFGCKVTVISTSPRKKKEAIEHLGADTFLVSRDADQMQAAMGTMDGIIDTVSAIHLLLPLINLLKSHGKLVMLGIPDQPPELPIFPLLMGMTMQEGRLAGSAAGGLKETQEMIDFAAKHNIRPEIEVISMNYVNTAMERLAKGDVKYRFVIDIENTLAATKP
ncbi:putative mannitol dehydrogenase [Vitis vinifera]|uniref:Putative mannitol dehydrogenase n=1 Tax=Vitis vinifera TaxID=29760 RepID=A0A438FBI3_VITVI|nr:putative mannitol dehydrogenase [Vitis vinifera]